MKFMKKFLSLFLALLFIHSVTGQIDMGAMTIMSPSSTVCPSNMSSIVVRIKNYARTTIDFSKNPVTVAVSMTGASAQNFSTVVSSGTLACNTVLDVKVTTLANLTLTGKHDLYFYTSVLGEANAINDGRREFIQVNAPALTYTSGSLAQTVKSGSPIEEIVYAVGSSTTGTKVSGLPSGIKWYVVDGVLTIKGASAGKGIYTYKISTLGGACSSKGNLMEEGTITVL